MKPLSLTETEKRALSVLLIILISASIGVYLFRSPDNAFKAQESVGLQMETNPGRN